MKRADRPRTLEDFVDAARHDVPSERELGTVLTALVPFGASRLRGEPATPLARTLGVKLLVGGVVALAIGAAITAARTSSTEAPVRRSLEDAPVPSAVIAPRLAADATEGSPPRVDSPEPALEAPASPKKERRPSPARRAASASANMPPEKAGDRAQDAPAPLPQARVDARVDAEANLIEATRRALHSDPSAALSLAAEHAREFPSGLLSVEREALAIRALVLLGRRNEARARLESFERVHPRSVHVSRLHAFLGDDPSSSSR